MSQNYSPSVSSYDRPETPKYHSEPLFRKVARWWYPARAKQINGSESEKEAREYWAELESYDCPKEILPHYFRVIANISMIMSLLAGGLAQVLVRFTEDFSWWSFSPALLIAIFVSIAVGNYREAYKTKKNESYMGYFDGQKLCLAIVLGALAFAIICLGLSLFLVDPIWLEA